MLYLLFVLTFLTGILFYGMTPRDDKLQLDTQQAEGMIVTFLNQHQAARDYLFTWLGTRIDDSVGNTQGSGFLKPEFEHMTPKSMVLSVCEGNSGTPGIDDSCSGKFVSRVVCANDSGNVIGCDNANAKKRYVVTYGGWTNGYNRPDWWPSEGHRTRRYERWRRAITKRTRGSHNCGVLIKVSDSPAKWCIDNGERVFKAGSNELCLNQVPAAIINALTDSTNGYGSEAYLHDMLFCYSAFDQGVNPGLYPVTATSFYDGLSNVAVGEHRVGSVDWKDLITGASLWSDSVTFPTEATPYWFSDSHITPENGVLKTELTFGETFTLTILVRIHQNASAFSVLSVDTSPNLVDIFTRRTDEDKNEHFFEVKNTKLVANNTDAESELSAGGKVDRLISWTFVGQPCPDDTSHTCLTVYENVAKHDRYNLGMSLKDTKLVIGNNNNDFAYIYGIRYYDGKMLSDDEIKKNFKVDRKRFGIADNHNGMTNDEWNGLQSSIRPPVQNEEE